MVLEEKIKKIIEPILEEMNLILYELKYEKEDGENYLRIFLEKENEVMDLDTCVEASEKISLLLDKSSSNVISNFLKTPFNVSFWVVV